MQRLRERVPSGPAVAAATPKPLSPRSSLPSTRSNHSENEEGPLLPSLNDDKDHDVASAPWRRTAVPSAPSSSNLVPPPTTSLVTRIPYGAAATVAHWYAALIREWRVRWYFLTPTTRRVCTWGLVPLLVVACGTSTMDWMFQRHATWHDRTNAQNHDFVVVMNTYQRPKQLAQAVRHYADTCGTASGIRHVYIIWSEEGVVPPTPESLLSPPLRSESTRRRSTVSVVTVLNSLNSRFAPLPDVTDTAVFMVDDDIRVRCASLRAGFAAWKTHPWSMVGYYPRLAAPPRRRRAPGAERGTDTDTTDAPKQLVYQSWPVVFWRHELNFILTKACFLHSRYMSLYHDPTVHPVDILKYVDVYFNCEDVAMSLLVANFTKSEGALARPIYVEGSVSDKGLFNGISTGTGHMTRRSDCLIDLTAIYQRNGWGVPLDAAFSLRESSWVSHAPGFWWQDRPSNLFEWFALENAFQ